MLRQSLFGSIPLLISASLMLSSLPSLSTSQERLVISDRGEDIVFPLGALSFADSVVSFTKGDPSSNEVSSNPRAALRLPNWQKDGDGKSVTLGCKGSLILAFDDNALVDVDGPDLYVFEIGAKVEDTVLAISETGETWVDLGRIEGATAAVDIGQFVDARDIEYRFVRLTDAGTNCRGKFPGADIDAVAAIGAVTQTPPPEAQQIVKELTETRRVELDIQFEFNSHIPTLAGFQKIARFADAVGQMFDEVPDLTILGHTDAVGSAAYNLDLSERRASSVRGILIQTHGFPAQRLRARGLGESDLKYPGSPEADGNRRVEIRLSGDAAVAVAAPPPDRRDADGSFPRSLQGRYAPGGDCSGFLTVKVEVKPTQIEIEHIDLLRYHNLAICDDCAPGEVQARINGSLDMPLFRLNAYGEVGVMAIDDPGVLSLPAELKAAVEAAPLRNCALPKTATTRPAELAPSAQDRWVTFDTDRRMGASYCPVLDTSGGNSACLSIGCDAGRRIDFGLTLNGAPAGFRGEALNGLNAEILVDGASAGRLAFSRRDDLEDNRFRAPFDFQSHTAMLRSLRRGNQAELRMNGEGQSAAMLMPLSGSSAALRDVLKTCNEAYANATPVSAPGRFIGGAGRSTPEAVVIAETALAGLLDEMRREASKPDIGIENAWLVEFEDGWRFVTADIGFSNFHFGMGGFGNINIAQPPGEEWRQIGPRVPSASTMFDTVARSNGWPRLLFRSQRNANAPYRVWRWDGRQYVFEREIAR